MRAMVQVSVCFRIAICRLKQAPQRTTFIWQPKVFRPHRVTLIECSSSQTISNVQDKCHYHISKHHLYLHGAHFVHNVLIYLWITIFTFRLYLCSD